LLLLAVGGVADEGDAALVEDVDVVGDGEGAVDVLLDDEERAAFGSEAGDRGEDLVDDDGLPLVWK
jgi:hypothetical protein